MREWINRVVDLVQRRRLERELDDELAFHRQQIEQERIADGRNPGDARRDARLRLGNAASIRETTRERWGFPSLDHLLRDTRYAARSLRRSPAFTLAVVATLSLGIGANAAMFDVTDRLMFRPLANLRDPGTVHRLYMQSTGRNGITTDSWLPYGRYQDFQKWTQSFSTFAGFNERVLRVGSGELALERQIAAVSATYFDLFDAPPVQGRYFTTAEDCGAVRRAGLGAVARVLADEFRGARRRRRVPSGRIGDDDDHRRRPSSDARRERRDATGGLRPDHHAGADFWRADGGPAIVGIPQLVGQRPGPAQARGVRRGGHCRRHRRLPSQLGGAARRGTHR
jgi:hypothetical protein